MNRRDGRPRSEGSGAGYVRSVVRTAGTNVITVGLGSIAGVILARVLGPGGRGTVAALLAWTGVVAIVASIGLTQATCYWVAKDATRAREFVRTAVLIGLVLGSSAGILGASAAAVLVEDGAVRLIFVAGFAAVPLVIVGGIWTSALQALEIRAWNRARLIQPTVYFVGTLLLWSIGSLSVLTSVGVLLTAIAAQAAVARHLVTRNTSGEACFQRVLVRPLLQYGWRTSLSALPVQVNYRLDQVVLSLIVTAGTLGNYAVAVSLAALASPIGSAFGSIAFPQIAGSRSTHEIDRIQRHAIFGSLAAAAALLLPLALVAPWLVPALFGPGFERAVLPFRILTLGSIVYVMNQVIGDVLRGRGRPLVPALAEGLAAIVTVVLLMILVPAYGVRGAAITSTIAYAAASVVLIVALRRARARGTSFGRQVSSASGTRTE